VAGVIMKTQLRKMKIMEIDNIVTENELMKSFYFVDEIISRAIGGQFVMLWVPHVISESVNFDIPDQIPMSISSIDGSRFSLTVRDYGETTHELLTYSPGDRVGITGPLGRGFSGSGTRILCIAGGTGVAPLLLLAQHLQNREIHFILGAKTEAELLFQEKLRNLCSSLYITTDDGSCGFRGFASDPVEDFCRTYEIDQIYSCGPERMMYKVFETAVKLDLPAEFSLERYMYCGLGVCGHCAINGYLVCKDGPVFTSEELRNSGDFGVTKVDETGRKVNI
jgi:dihydroorotate dehydrogenase electron transfer subunit